MVLSSMLCLKIEVPSLTIGFQSAQTNEAEIAMTLHCTVGGDPEPRFSEVWLCCSSFHPHVQGSRHFIFLSIKEHLDDGSLWVTQTLLTEVCSLFQRGSTQPHSHRQEDRIRSHFLVWKHKPWIVNIFFFSSLSTAGSMSHTGTRVFCRYPVTSCVLPLVLKLFNKILSCFQVEFQCPSFPWLTLVGGSRSDGSCLRSGVGRTLASFCVYNWICDSSCESLSSSFLLQLPLPAALAPGTNL